jgi:hypothetical protein
VPDDPRLTLAQMVEAIKTSAPIEPCLPTAPSGLPHRVSLREFLSLVRHGVAPIETIPAYIGIGPTTALTLSEWAVWLLRERLADTLVTAKN